MNDPEARAPSPTAGFPPSAEARVTLDNWQQPPWNRWSFLHTRELLPSANVSRGTGATWVLSGEPAALEDIRVGSVAGEKATLRGWLDGSWTDGLIMLKRGRIVFEVYRNGMEPDVRHLVMSVSKSITSLLIGILVDEGLIRPASPVTAYARELAGTAFEGATVQHLLDMEIATSWREDYGGPGSEYWRLDAACGWCPPHPGMAGALFDFMRELGPAGRHGKTMLYSSPNTDLLAIIAERVTETRFARLVSSRLWAPMGAEFDADIMLDPAGSAIADGGFCIALRDMARIGQLFLDRGRGVVPVWWIEECERGNPEPFAHGSYGADLPAASYHNQWWHFDGRTFALGIHGQMIAIDRPSEVVVGLMSTAPAPTDPAIRDVQRSVVEALTVALR